MGFGRSVRSWINIFLGFQPVGNSLSFLNAVCLGDWITGDAVRYTNAPAIVPWVATARRACPSAAVFTPAPVRILRLPEGDAQLHGVSQDIRREGNVLWISGTVASPTCFPNSKKMWTKICGVQKHPAKFWSWSTTGQIFFVFFWILTVGHVLRIVCKFAHWLAEFALHRLCCM